MPGSVRPSVGPPPLMPVGPAQRPAPAPAQPVPAAQVAPAAGTLPEAVASPVTTAATSASPPVPRYRPAVAPSSVAPPRAGGLPQLPPDGLA